MVCAAEAAFIAEISDRNLHRLIDEHILPASLYRQGEARSFSKLACAFARFYFDTDHDLTKSLRQRVIHKFAEMPFIRDDWCAVMALSRPIAHADWTVQLPFGLLELHNYMIRAQDRSELIERACGIVELDDAVKPGGVVFKGTQIPVYPVGTSLNRGMPVEQVRESYPQLTDDMLSLAQVYVRVHPPKGRPRRLG